MIHRLRNSLLRKYLTIFAKWRKAVLGVWNVRTIYEYSFYEETLHGTFWGTHIALESNFPATEHDKLCSIMSTILSNWVSFCKRTPSGQDKTRLNPLLAEVNWNTILFMLLQTYHSKTSPWLCGKTVFQCKLIMIRQMYCIYVL